MWDGKLSKRALIKSEIYDMKKQRADLILRVKILTNKIERREKLLTEQTHK
jgi:hypothetical protein